MKNQNLFKALLMVQTIVVLGYTILAFKSEGANLLDVFLTNIKSLNWNGQFNLDFSCYLTLSGLWIVWRNQYSFSSILIALFAATIGIIFFAPYLIYLLIIEKGDLKKVLVGNA